VGNPFRNESVLDKGEQELETERAVLWAIGRHEL